MMMGPTDQLDCSPFYRRCQRYTADGTRADRENVFSSSEQNETEEDDEQHDAFQTAIGLRIQNDAGNRVKAAPANWLPWKYHQQLAAGFG
jgi:hypothetical protein